jgi:hypothetical protein
LSSSRYGVRYKYEVDDENPEGILERLWNGRSLHTEEIRSTMAHWHIGTLATMVARRQGAIVLVPFPGSHVTQGLAFASARACVCLPGRDRL